MRVLKNYAKQVAEGQEVPPIDSPENILVRDVVGNKDDEHGTMSVAGQVHELVEHTHEAAKCIPSGAAGVVVTAGDSEAWDLGSFAVMSATNAIDEDFDIHFVVVEVMSANATYEIVLYAGADGSEVEIGRVRVVRVTNQVRSSHLAIQTPIIAANTQIKAKVMSSTGALDAVTLTLFYHIY